MSKRSQTIITAFTLIVITLPYLVAAWGGGEDHVFNGFLLNPLDGNSYLAKMRLGYDGNWRFSLPFYEKTMEGPFLFLFYFFLGHVARILNLSLVFTFHATRIISAVIFCFVLAKFIKLSTIGLTARVQTFAFGLTLFGSGLGWLAAFFGGFTSDFWVAEAYPFLSLYSNPHFILGITLLLGYFTSMLEQPTRKKLLGLALTGILEAIVLPFAVVIAGIVTVGYQTWELVVNKNKIRWGLLLFLVPAGIFLLYQFIAITGDPILTQWNNQNVTLSPPFGDFLLSFSPVIVGALSVVFLLWKQKNLNQYKIFIIWLFSGLLLAYFPFQLQRRFLLGYYIPLSILSAMIFELESRGQTRIPRYAMTIFFTISILTNVFILAGGLNAIARKDTSIYYSTDIQAGFKWMDGQSGNGHLVLAAPETSLVIPGQTGWRVVYGHPYETPDAEIRKAEVEDIFSKKISKQEIDLYLMDHKIEYIFVGPFETKGNNNSLLFNGYPSVFLNNTVEIYQTGFGR